MRRFFSFIFALLIPMHAFASVEFSSLLPNPAGKDEDGEYIEIRNTGCESADISGYNLSDASGKTYSIPSGVIIGKQENRRFPYSETKITLNNSGDEAVYLRDMSGNMVDEVHYSGTQKDDVVITLSLTDESCLAPEVTNSGTTTDSSTGAMDAGSGEVFTDSGSTSGTGEVLSDSGSGEILSDSGNTLSDSSSVESGTGGIGSGTLQTEESSGSMYTETGTLTPLEMYYSDLNGDSRIDTLEISYPYILTGGVNTGAIELYSNTGGLFSYRINTLTGYIVDGYLSGNILVLKVLEGDIDKTILKVNNATSSELRLKSAGELGFRSLGGQIPENFLLTSSFDSYKKVYARSFLAEDGNINSETGIPDSSPSESHDENAGTGIITFPEIIPTFQNYTNTTNSGDLLTCITMPCRVNFTIEPIFTGAFLEKDFTCQITFGTGVYDTCNPPQLYPTSSGSIEILLIDKATRTSTGKTIVIDVNLATTSSATANIVPIDNHSPIAVIDMDGKWKKYFTSPDVSLLRCYAFTCSVNFTGEHSYDPDGDQIRFFWLYDYTSISTSRDPGTRTFGIGTHTVVLRVIDTYDAVGEVKYMIEVLSPDLMPKEEKKKVEKKEKIANIKTSKISKKKIRPIVFFDVPDILLQNKNPENIKIAGNQYTCYTKTKTCSVNFTLTGAQSGYTYEWSFPGQSGSYISKNPRSFAFPVGASEVGFIVRDLAGNILVNRNMNIQVIKTTKTRNIGNTLIKEKVTTIPAVISPAKEDFSSNEMSVTSSNPGDDSLLFLIFLSGSGLAGYVRVRKKRKQT